jgi:hypothetical protein
MEPKEAKKWGFAPTVLSRSSSDPPKESPQLVSIPERIKSGRAPEPQSRIEAGGKGGFPSQRRLGVNEENAGFGSKEAVDKSLPLLQVILRLSKSSRALVALVISFVYGYAQCVGILLCVA